MSFLTIEDFIKKATAKHGDRYDYRHVDYINNKTPVEILCSIHGPFSKRPNDHLARGQGCPACGRLSSVDNRRKTADKFIEEARRVHGDKYDYSRVVYKNALTKVEIGIAGHWFWQTPANHLSGHGSVKERNDLFADKYGWTNKQFVDRAREVHGDRFKYDFCNYTGSHSYVTIECLTHGPFEQLAYCHINGEQGCPVCSNTFSSEHAQVCNFLGNLGFAYEINNRKILSQVHPERRKLELDIVMEDSKIAIEYCGLRFHTQKLRGKTIHLEKLQLANIAGYRLITVFSDEWNNKRDIVKRRLKSICGVAERGVGARQLTIRDISWKDAKYFLATNHLQGSGTPGRFRYGAFAGDKLVAVMTFGLARFQSGPWEMLRYCTDGKHYPGVAAKLFAFFVKTVDPSSVISYADRRWSDGNLYEKLGFKRIAITEPAFFVIAGNYTSRKNRYHYAKIKPHDKGRTQLEIIEDQGLDLIWDCGSLTYSWERRTVESRQTI